MIFPIFFLFSFIPHSSLEMSSHFGHCFMKFIHQIGHYNCACFGISQKLSASVSKVQASKQQFVFDRCFPFWNGNWCSLDMSIASNIFIILTHRNTSIAPGCIWMFWHTWSFYHFQRSFATWNRWFDKCVPKMIIFHSVFLSTGRGLVYVTHIGNARARYLLMPLVQFWFFFLSEIYQDKRERKKTKQIFFLKPKILLVMF